MIGEIVGYTACSVAIGWVVRTVVDGYAYDHIQTYRTRYEKVLEKYGLSLKVCAGWEGPVTWDIVGDRCTIYYMSSYRVKRLLRGLARGDVTIEDLEAMSEAPFCRIP